MKFEWKDEDTVAAVSENGEVLKEIRISEIPMTHWWDEKDPSLLRLNDGKGSAACVSREELIKSLPDYFEGKGEFDSGKPRSLENLNISNLWNWMCLEHFCAYLDASFFEDPDFEFDDYDWEESFEHETDIVSFGVLKDKYEVYIVKNDTGFYPHFHIRTVDGKKHWALQLNCPGSYLHEHHTMLFPFGFEEFKDRAFLWDFLGWKENPRKISYRTVYSKLIEAWNEHNPRYQTSVRFTNQGILIPDYSKSIQTDRWQNIGDVASLIPEEISDNLLVIITSDSIYKRKAAREIYDRYQTARIIEDDIYGGCVEEIWHDAIFCGGGPFWKYYRGRQREGEITVNEQLKPMGHDFDFRLITDETFRKAVYESLLVSAPVTMPFYPNIYGKDVVLLHDGTDESKKSNDRTIEELAKAYRPKSVRIIDIPINDDF